MRFARACCIRSTCFFVLGSRSFARVEGTTRAPVAAGSILVGLGVLLPMIVQATTLRVPDEFSTLNEALDAAATGDTVLVAPGTYGDAETRDLPWDGGTRTFTSIAFLRAGICLKSEAGSANTFLDMSLATEVVGAARNAIGPGTGSETITIEGFTFLPGANPSERALELGGAHGDLTVRDCIFDGFESGFQSSAAIATRPFGLLSVFSSTFRNCRGSMGAALARAGNLHMEDCVLEDNQSSGGATVWLGQPGDPPPAEEARFVRCRFLRNWANYRAGAILGGEGFERIEVQECSFVDNSSVTNGGAIQLGLSQSRTLRVEGSLFVRNQVWLSSNGGAIWAQGGVLEVFGCTFHQNQAPNGAALSTLSTSRATIRGNVFTESQGSSAVLLSPGVRETGCNIFWNNDGDDLDGVALDPTDQRIDPQYCDPEADDYRVAASSPCLQGNHLTACVEQIGALGEGCPSTGIVPVGLRTTPDPIPVLVDGGGRVTPRLEPWEVGTIHEIGFPPSPVVTASGSRYWFQSWSNGGPENQEVTALDTYIEYVADFAAEHYLSVVADSGGTATPSEWVPRGESRELLAVPAEGFAFRRWLGTGEGSYTGELNPVTVSVNEPILQRALFIPLFLPLNTEVQGGGTVLPASASQPRETVVPIEAFPDEGWVFSHWIGTGQGSYSGPLNPASVLMLEPITQTAIFVDADPLLTMDVVGGGWVSPETAPQFIFTQVEIEATPALGWEFDRWHGFGDGSYTGRNNPATVTMNEPIYQTARFIIGELPLTVLAAEGGTVTPESGPVTSFTDVEIEAAASPGYRFVQWKGEGDGSYTGTDNPATVTLNGPITQVASFEPSAFSATLSLSDTDPYAHTGAAIGLGNVHLWVTCGTTEHGLRSVRLNAAGSLQPLAFLPAPGVAASGTGSVLASIDGCPDGAVRLGSFLVNSPGEGSLCLDVTGALPGLTITDCEGTVYSWPENVGFVGVHTGGGAPCGGGSGCEAIDPFAAPVGAPDVAAAPSDTRLAGIFPNPFGDGTTIEFDVARAMEIRLSVFDVGGRQVRVLREGSVPAGRHAVGWDGRDSGGRAVSAGVYFVRLTGDGLERTEKVTVVRGRP